MSQRRWIELLKDYDCKILYHPDKDNVVADMFSNKSAGMLAHILVSECRVIKVAQQIKLRYFKRATCLIHLIIQPELIQRINEAQLIDFTLAALSKDI